MAAEPADGLEFSYKPDRKHGGGALHAKLAGKSIHTRKMELADPEARSAALDAVCADRPGIDRGAAAELLEDLAGRCVEDDSEEQPRRSQADLMVELAAEADLFHDGETAYASVNVRPQGSPPDTPPHRETYPVHAKGFRLWLARRFWEARGKAAGSQAMQDALTTLSSRAKFDGPQRPVAVRVAGHDGSVYLDLCNDRWEAVRVSADGWEVVSDPPVRFVRRRGMQPLPAPVRGGRLDELRPLINAGREDLWRLMVAWLIGALRPSGPYPVLAVNGEQGSGKSTTSRMLRRLIDPNEADLRTAPKDERDLMIAASNSAVVGFDNLSAIPPELSDALCRLATGGGFATRELYSNAEEQLFSATRPILFNGIEELATRADLLERSLVLNLPTIREAGRRSERALWHEYEQVRPRVLGALLDAVAAALRNLASVRLERRPRMADFAEWIVAAEPALPWPAGAFLETYRANIESANELAVEASALGPSVLGLMSAVDRWDGTAKELQAQLESDRHSDQKTRQRRDWPKTPKGFSNVLRRIAPALRRLGVETEFERDTGRERRRLIHLENAGVGPSGRSEPSADSLSAAAGGLAADGRGRSADGVLSWDRPAQSAAGGPETGTSDGPDDADGSHPADSYTASANGDGRDRGRL